MLMWRAKELLEGGSELLRAEVELASRRLRRLLVDSAVMGAGLVVGLVGCGALLAAAAIAIAGEMGWIWSLVIIGSPLLAAGLSVCVWAAAAAKSESPSRHAEAWPQQRHDPEADIAEAKERLHNAATPGMDPEYAPPRERMGPHDAPNGAMAFAARNPLLVGSAAFLAVSLFGPKRAVRLASRGVALAGLAASLLEHVGPSDDHPVHKSAGSPPPPMTRPARASRATNGFAPPPAGVDPRMPMETRIGVG